LWSERHRPRRLEDLVGNEEARAKLLLWLKKWKPGVKAALLVGPPGTGKTTTVELAAKELGMLIVELNASDARTRERLSKKIGEATASANLYGTGSLIFLDEVDGLAGRSDYGAIDFIKDAVRKSRSPVVMAANDPESDEVRKLAAVTVKLVYHRPEVELVEKRLLEIAALEGVEVAKGDVLEVAVAANGDLRAAINFLQAGLPARKDEDVTAAEAVNSFFEAVDEKSAVKALRTYPGQPREKLRDLFTAVVRSKVHEERKAAALEALSRADLLLGRMMRGKDWRLLRYLDPILAAGVWGALGDGGPRYTMDAVPWPLQLRIWNDSKKLKEVAGLAGRRLGISQKGFLVEDMPYLLQLCREEGFRGRVVGSLGLEENYSEFMAKEARRGIGR
jgi:replication factor C large subunit